MDPTIHVGFALHLLINITLKVDACAAKIAFVVKLAYDWVFSLFHHVLPCQTQGPLAGWIPWWHLITNTHYNYHNALPHVMKTHQKSKCESLMKKSNSLHQSRFPHEHLHTIWKIISALSLTHHVKDFVSKPNISARWVSSRAANWALMHVCFLLLLQEVLIFFKLVLAVLCL